jgi:7-cyano-7-deazaguanine reductase
LFHLSRKSFFDVRFCVLECQISMLRIRKNFFDWSLGEFKETDCLCHQDVLYLKKMKKEIDTKKIESKYTEKEAKAGLEENLPAIETFPNQFSDYEIRIEVPEFTSICPKTGLPDFGVLDIRYIPDKLCLELKSLKMYLLGYRNLGIFYENVVNRILKDIVDVCRPVQATVIGEFNPRGGIKSIVEANFPKGKK